MRQSFFAFINVGDDGIISGIPMSHEFSSSASISVSLSLRFLTYSVRTYCTSSSTPHMLQFGDSVLCTMYANFFNGMHPSLSLRIILTNCLLNLHPVNDGIRSRSDCIDLYQVLFSLDTLLKCSFHF